MSNWKFIDDTNAVVFRTNEDGSCESHLVEVIADWLAEGNTPEPADPLPPAPPIIVSPWQIRKALNATGLREAVESAVAAADTTTKDAWQYATSFVRTEPLLDGMAKAMGKTDAEIDALFELAETL